MMCGRHLVAFVLHRSMMSHHGGKILFDMNGPLCYNPRHLNRIHPPDEGAQMARMPCAQWGKTGESPALARNGNLSSTDRKPELPPSSFGMTTPRGTGGPCVRSLFTIMPPPDPGGFFIGDLRRQQRPRFSSAAVFDFHDLSMFLRDDFTSFFPHHCVISHTL